MGRALAPLLGLLASVWLAGCAAPQAARMDMPPALRSLAEERIEGAGAGRSGTWRVAGFEGRFERSADRLTLFDEALARDRAHLRLQWRTAEGRDGEATCKAARVEGSAGVLAAALRPFALECTLGTVASGAAERAASLRLEGRAAAAGTRQERGGRLRTANGTELDIRSVHRVEGSPLPLEAPFGYVLSRAGTPVAAVELNGMRPRLWRPAAGSDAARDDVTVALVALALFWDPAR